MTFKQLHTIKTRLSIRHSERLAIDLAPSCSVVHHTAPYRFSRSSKNLSSSHEAYQVGGGQRVVGTPADPTWSVRSDG
jgi:hypothetical protein